MWIYTHTFKIRSLWTFAVCRSFTGSISTPSPLFSALFLRDSSRSVLHFANITDLELLTFLHRIFAMTLAMPLTLSGIPSSSCNGLAMSPLFLGSVTKQIKMICRHNAHNIANSSILELLNNQHRICFALLPQHTVISYKVASWLTVHQLVLCLSDCQFLTTRPDWSRLLWRHSVSSAGRTTRCACRWRFFK